MSKHKGLLAVGLVAVLAASAAAQNVAEQPIPKLVEQATASLARLQFKVFNPLVGEQPQIGQAICIDAAKSVFVTYDIPPGVPADEMKDFVLIPPGSGTEEFKAELMGVDPEERLSFLHVVVPHKWQTLRFSAAANLELGQKVLSVGLLGPNSGNVPYLGTGLVGARLRLPGQIIYVTGGDLTIPTSPVMTLDGRVIGIVGDQMPMEYRLNLGGRWGDVVMMGRQRTEFFLPVDEFAHVLAEVPTLASPRRLPWMGVVNFEPVLPAQAALETKLGDRGAVMVGQVIDQTPASKQGLLQSDLIVAVGGKPIEKMPTPELTAAAFRRQIIRMKPGQTVALTVLRKGKEEEKKVTLEPSPPYPHEAPRYYSANLGFAARDLVTLDRYAGRATPLEANGVVVTMVRQNSPAATGQLRPNDLVTAVNGKAIVSVAAITATLDPLSKPGTAAPITLLVQRGDTPQAIVITPPSKEPPPPAPTPAPGQP